MFLRAFLHFYEGIFQESLGQQHPGLNNYDTACETVSSSRVLKRTYRLKVSWKFYS